MSRSACVSRPRPLSCCARSNAAARIVAIGNRLADRRDLVVGRRLLVLTAIDAELRFDLAQRAFGAVERELQLARFEPDEHVAGPDLGAELHADFADDAGDLAADLRLSGDISVPDRSTSRWTDIRWTVRRLGRDGRRRRGRRARRGRRPAAAA